MCKKTKRPAKLPTKISRRKDGKQKKRKAALATLARRVGGEQKAKAFMEQVDELDRANAERREAIQAHPTFDDETRKLRQDFQVAYSHNPEPITSFLQRFGRPVFFNLQEALQQIAEFPPAISDLLRRYMKYSSRFGVYFTRRENQFEWGVVPAVGRIFYAEQLNGRLKPSAQASAEAIFEHRFEDRQLKLPGEVQKLFDAKNKKGEETAEAKEIQKNVKYLKVKDVEGSSVLNDIESFAYHQGVTLIHHEAERDYLYLLIGEGAKKELLDGVGKAVTEFQVKQLGRPKAGRHKNLPAREVLREALKGPGSMKEKAGKIDTRSKISSVQSQLSRIKEEDK